MSRYVGCHSDCDKYLAYKARLAENSKKQQKERLLNDFSIERAAKTAKAKQNILRK